MTTPKELPMTPIDTTAPKPCGLGCDTRCEAKAAGCASECPSLEWRTHIQKAAAPAPLNMTVD